MDLEQMAREWLGVECCNESVKGTCTCDLEDRVKRLTALLRRVCDETDEEWLGRKP